MTKLTHLPKEIGHAIAALLSPLARMNLGGAFISGNAKFNFTAPQERSEKVWSKIFKDDSWFEALDRIPPQHGPGSPNPTLVGIDLAKLYYNPAVRSSTYIALLVSDWSGECQYLKEAFFASLQDHTYDEESQEVRFRNSKIILNVHDAVRGTDGVEMKDPKRLFACSKKQLETAALCYKEDGLKKIDHQQIGTIVDLPTRKMASINYLCSIPLTFGDGTALFRIIEKKGPLPFEVINQVTILKGKEWVTSWRVAS